MNIVFGIIEFVAGFFLAIFWCYIFVIPLFYDLPLILISSFRGLLSWRAPIHCLAYLIVWYLFSLGLTTVIIIFMPSFTDSEAFGAGYLLGLFGAVGSTVFTQSGRADLRLGFYRFALPYIIVPPSVGRKET